jgi:hypothetical protein
MGPTLEVSNNIESPFSAVSCFLDLEVRFNFNPFSRGTAFLSMFSHELIPWAPSRETKDLSATSEIPLPLWN